MKSDTQLQRDIIDEIKWEPSVTATRIGVVTLSGMVATYPGT